MIIDRMCAENLHYAGSHDMDINILRQCHPFILQLQIVLSIWLLIINLNIHSCRDTNRNTSSHYMNWNLL
jgi:hypothetical protein